MPKFIDLTNQKFGRLTAIKPLQIRLSVNKTKIYWECLCECGNLAKVASSYLKAGHTKSCGCLNKEQSRLMGKGSFLGEGVALKRRIFQKYKKSAEYRNISFDLKFEPFISLVFNPCFYCGDSLKSVSKRPEVNQELAYTGLDRIDSKKGYEINNVVPCCCDCNVLKMESTKEDFFLMIKTIYERHKLNEK